MRKLDHLFSIRFTTHVYLRLVRAAEQDNSTIARLIRKWVLAGLSAAEADWYANPVRWVSNPKGNVGPWLWESNKKRRRGLNLPSDYCGVQAPHRIAVFCVLTVGHVDYHQAN